MNSSTAVEKSMELACAQSFNDARLTDIGKIVVDHVDIMAAICQRLRASTCGCTYYVMPRS